MMSEQVIRFIEGLIEKTRDRKLEWKCFSVFGEKCEIYKEFKENINELDDNEICIKEYSSYFLESGEGYVFLLEIYHKLQNASVSTKKSLALLIKVNSILPMEDLTQYADMEQGILRQLQGLIEVGIKEKYSYPDIIYDFFRQILNNN